MLSTAGQHYPNGTCNISGKNIFSPYSLLLSFNISPNRETYGKKDVTVTVTPNGYADAITDGHFVLPEEKLIPMEQFLQSLEKPVADRVYYIQKQNSNLTEEFPELIGDSASEIQWASEVFGSKPDAVNFWMGDERAITSSKMLPPDIRAIMSSHIYETYLGFTVHKDPYENMYCVVSGHKDFILHPPTDQPWIPYADYPKAIYREVDGDLTIFPEEGCVPWISIDPLNPDFAKYPNYKKARQVCCRVQKGEMLYLPSLWFHHVRQSHGCIAVNYWYDMSYDIKYNYFEFVKDLISST